MILSIEEEGWPQVAERIGRSIDLEASARASGALRRKRHVRSASDLLRLALAYGPGGQSLRQTAAWAHLQRVAEFSNVALMYRLQDAADWLGEVAGALLAHRSGEPDTSVKGLGLRIRVVDGSVISSPGSGPRWRLHGVYNVAGERFSQVELTTDKGAEALERAALGPGELVMGDRVFARPKGLAHVVTAGAHFLVRLGRRSLTLAQQDGSDFDLAKLLDESDQTGVCDRPVRVIDPRGPKDAPALTARVIVLKKPPEAAEQARRQALRQSQRGGHDNDPLSLRAAEHLMLITSLDPEQASPDALAALYRIRWRIELAFKRLKSLLRIDRLPAKDEKLAKAWLFAHLITAFLIEDLTPELRDSPP
jgi:hypothetical protein